MTTLPSGPPIAERQTSNHDCVPSAVAWILQRLGFNITEVDVVNWLTAHGYDLSSGVTIEHAAEYLKAHQIPYDLDDGTEQMALYVADALANRWYCVGFHQCDGNANPVPVGTSNIRHARSFFGNDGGYETMNPWPPANETVGDATMNDADTRQHLTIKIPAPEEDDMSAADVAAVNSFTQARANELSTKLDQIIGNQQIGGFVVTIPAGKSWTYSGGTDKTQFNIQAQGDEGAMASVEVFLAHFPNGDTFASTPTPLVSTANHDNVHGPLPATGTVASIASVGFSGPCEIEWKNAGPADIEVTVHP